MKTDEQDLPRSLCSGCPGSPGWKAAESRGNMAVTTLIQERCGASPIPASTPASTGHFLHRVREVFLNPMQDQITSSLQPPMLLMTVRKNRPFLILICWAPSAPSPTTLDTPATLATPTPASGPLHLLLFFSDGCLSKGHLFRKASLELPS